MNRLDILKASLEKKEAKFNNMLDSHIADVKRANGQPLNDKRNGCSVCQPGKENYTTYTTKLGRKSLRMYQYDYRTESGELFSSCAHTLEACREKRDKWLQKNNHNH